MRRRIGITGRFIIIFTIISLPLAVTIAVIHLNWYEERVDRELNERVTIALNVRSTFTTLISDLGKAMIPLGREAIEYEYSESRTATIFRRLLIDYPVSAVVLTTADGVIVSSTQTKLNGVDLGEEKAFRQVIRDGKDLGVGDSHRTQSGIGIFVAQAVRSNDGRLFGVVGSFVEVGKLHKTLSIEGNAVGVNIVDASGRIIYQNEFSELAREGVFWGDYVFVKQALNGKRSVGRFMYPPTHSERLIAEIPIERYGWAAGSSIDYERSISPILRSTIVSALVALSILVLAIVISFIFARGIIESVDLLVAKARDIGEGRLDEPVVLDTGDEIEDIAVSLEEARINLSQAIAEVNAISQVADVAVSTLNTDQLLNSILERLLAIMGGDTAVVLLKEDNILMVQASKGVVAEAWQKQTVRIGEGFAGTIAKTTATLYIEDARTSDFVIAPPIENSGIRSMLGVPMTIGAQLIGVLHVGWFGIHPRDEREIRLLRIVADRIGLALNNVRLYEVERHIADTLQEALLTMPEHLDFVEYGRLYRSATDTTEVGGDFYDLFEIEHGRIGIILGDVSGKGIEAATATATVKNAIKAFSYEYATPGEIMMKTNDLVVKNTPSSIFITVFFGILNVVSGDLRYCSAGHPPALVKRGRSVDLLRDHSPIIGAFSGLGYVSGETKLGKDDILFAYTDGVIEARCDNELFGEERLLEFFDSLDRVSAKELPKKVFDHVEKWSKGAISDDVAMLAVSLLGGGDSER